MSGSMIKKTTMKTRSKGFCRCRVFAAATVVVIAAGAWLTSGIKIRASVSRAFRLPTFTDLYYHDPANRGSPDLRPESAWSYEAGRNGFFAEFDYTPE